MTRIREEEVATDKYHIQVYHHLRGDTTSSLDSSVATVPETKTKFKF